MKKVLTKITSIIVVLLPLCILSSCGDDNEDNGVDTIVGKWLSIGGDYDAFYQFDSDGTGRYICLSDDPGYNPEYPEPAIRYPLDYSDFTYTFDGATLTLYGVYEFDEMYTVVFTNGTLQMRYVKSKVSEDEEWEDIRYSEWWTYKPYK